MGFILHTQLHRDCAEVTDLPLTRVLLMKDARFPWLVLVPRRQGVSELTDLREADRMQLMSEMTRTADALKRITGAHKMNIATLGNHVPQLHLHIIARFREDAAWPNPVWGSGPAQHYVLDARERLIYALRAALGTTE